MRASGRAIWCASERGAAHLDTGGATHIHATRRNLFAELSYFSGRGATHQLFREVEVAFYCNPSARPFQFALPEQQVGTCRGLR